MNRRQPQAGLSLIELLVVIVLSAFLVLGVAQIYVDNKRSYVFQQGQSETQEGARYAMLLLQQELGKAGFRRLPDQDYGTAFPASAALANCSFATGQTVLWHDASSSLCIRYQPRTSTERDCLGNTPAAIPADPYTSTSVAIIERFYLQGGRLMCATPAGAGELMTGVGDAQFEFGLADSEGRAVASYVGANSAGANIVAVRYRMLLASSAGGLRDTADDSPVLEQWATITGLSVNAAAALAAADDRQLYRIAEGTVMLRNLLP